MSIPNQISDAVAMQAKCLEIVRIWMGRIESLLRLNPGKTEWLWVFGPPGPNDSLSLTLDRVPLPGSV